MPDAMTYRSLLFIMLFSLLLTACGQQGPLFMPIEDQPTSPPIENPLLETEAQ